MTSILDWFRWRDDGLPHHARREPRSLVEELRRMGNGEMFLDEIEEPEVDDMTNYQREWRYATGRGE